jgi:PAS domain S-box-containing protein
MPNSAFALFLLGTAGESVLQRRCARLKRFLVTFAVIIVLAISLGTVAEYALGSQLFLNQLVQHGKGPYYSSLSSPPSALAFALLAAGILLFDWRSGKHFLPAEWFILSTALIAVTALLGYLYGASATYRLTGPPIVGIAPTSIRLIRVAGDLLVIGVSLFTAVGLLLISTGLFFGRSDWGSLRIVAGPGPSRLLLRRLIPVVILIPIGFGIIASRFPGTGDNPVVLAGLTDGTTMMGLVLLGITGRRLNQGHDALECERKRARDVIELASDGIFIANLEGRLIEVNEAGCLLVGYTREELLNKTITDLIPRADAERFQNHKAYLLQGHADLGEWVGIKKDGSLFPVEVGAKILPDGRWIGIVRDISVRKRMEDALRLSEATARKATKARDDMLGIVAHDLRNPLQVVATDAGTLRASSDVVVQKIGDDIQRAIQRMDRLIQDLLDVTRIDAGQLFVRPARVPVRELIEDTLHTQKVLASSADIDLQSVVPSDIPDVWADPNRVTQALDNLIGNAIKFTKPGGRITLAAESRPGEVVFSVADTGLGIAEGDLPHVFDRFWQTSKMKKDGAGLGLAIVKGIVNAHSGRVWAESSPGQGSTFFFTVPTAPQTAQAPLDNRIL